MLTNSSGLLDKSYFFNFDHVKVVEFAEHFAGKYKDPLKIAINLFYAVRDEIAYNPYTVLDGAVTLKASYCLRKNEAYCIPKAVLLGACARYFKIPARLGFADVINHLASKKLLKWLKSDVFTMHGYTELYLNNKWVKVSPAFNKEVCERFGVEALEFDGVNDAMLQEYSPDGTKHMEYIKKHGSFNDVPLDFFIKNVKKHYPHILDMNDEKWQIISKNI